MDRASDLGLRHRREPRRADMGTQAVARRLSAIPQGDRGEAVVLELEPEGTMRSAAVPAIGSSWRWFALLALVVALVAAGVLFGMAAILLVGCMVAGVGITYLSGIALNLEERLAFGTVLGALAGSVAAFALSLAAGG